MLADVILWFIYLCLNVLGATLYFWNHKPRANAPVNREENEAKADLYLLIWLMEEVAWWCWPDFSASCHKHMGLYSLAPWQAQCVASFCCMTLICIEWGGPWRWSQKDEWLKAALTSVQAGRRWPRGLRTMWPAVRVLGSFSGCWLQRWQQPSFFHTGRSSNRSLPLKQQRSVVAPEPVLCMCCFFGCGVCALKFVCEVYPRLCVCVCVCVTKSTLRCWSDPMVFVILTLNCTLCAFSNPSPGSFQHQLCDTSTTTPVQ